MANQGSQIGGGKPVRLEVLQGLIPVGVGCEQLPVRCGGCGVFCDPKGWPRWSRRGRWRRRQLDGAVSFTFVCRMVYLAERVGDRIVRP